MRGVTHARIEAGIRDAALPTYENLVKHVEKYGLSNAASKKRTDRYTTYKKFAKDSAAEVAFSHLTEDGYVRFVNRFGDPAWEDQARADYQAERGEE